MPPVICAIREFSRTFYVQKGKRKLEVQSPHNTTQNKARDVSSASMCHGMMLEGYHIIKMNYPNSWPITILSPLIPSFGCNRDCMKN